MQQIADFWQLQDPKGVCVILHISHFKIQFHDSVAVRHHTIWANKLYEETIQLKSNSLQYKL